MLQEGGLRLRVYRCVCVYVSVLRFDCAVVDIGSGRLPSFDYYRYHRVISHYEPLTAKSDLNFYS